MASISTRGAFDYVRDVAMDDDLEPNRDVCLPHFNCMGKVNVNDHTFHPNSYVASTEFDCLLDLRVPHAGFLDDEPFIQLFGHSFNFEESFFSDSNTLLNFAKSCYTKIEHSAKGSLPSMFPVKALKQSLVEYLAYCRTHVHRYLSIFGHEDSYESFYSNLGHFIDKITLWTSSVMELPNVIFSGGSLASDSALSAFFHVHFDIKWSLVEICFMAANLKKYNESCRANREKFSEILKKLQENLVADLMYLSFKRYLELNPNELAGVSPFVCTCVKELWLMLLSMPNAAIYSSIQNIYQQNHQNSNVIQTFQDLQSVHLPTKDPVAAVWLITHLSKLSGYNSSGTFDQNFSRVEPSYDVVNRFIQIYVNGIECAPSEERSKGLTSCLFNLSTIWGSNLNLCINLWEFFSRRLDENNPSSFDALPYASSVTWYELLNSNLAPWKSPPAKLNSYFIYLKVLSRHLETMNAKNQQSMKARLFVKLQSKKLQESTQMGVFNFLSACLTFIQATESADMVSKLLELVREIQKHKHIFFAAEVALLLILINRNRDCTEVAASISNQLEYVSRGLISELRDEQRKFGGLFVEGFREVVAMSRSFGLGQMKLIDVSLKNYLKNCGSCDRSSLIESLTLMLRKLKSGEELTSIITHIYPLMKEKFVDIDHVSFFIELTLVSIDQLNECQSMFTHFCLDEKVDPEFSLVYLSKLLENKQFTVSLSLSLDNYQIILIQSWFRISFLLPNTGEHREHYETIGSLIKRLPRMAELVVHSKITPNTGEMALDFLLTLSASLQNVPNFNERAIVKDNYLQLIGPLDRYLTCGSLTGTWEPADQVNHVIRLAGHLFFHCGNIIYTKGKADCLLVLLTNVLLTPLSFGDLNKELPSSVSAAFQKHLPMFVFGLTRLNPARDPYAVRSLSCVFQTFMTRYQANAMHPFTRCWTGLETEPITESLVPHVRTWFLQTIGSNVLPQRVARTSPYLAPTLQWLKFLVANEKWRLEIVKGVMLPILELSLILDEIPGKKSVTDFLQVAVCANEPAQMKVAEEALNELVSRQLAFNSNRLFKLIEVISFLNRELIKRILPSIKNQVAITEAKRGTGADSTLRQHLKTLEISLV